MIKKCLFIALNFTFLSSILFAEENRETITITADYDPSDPVHLPPSVTVISREDIEKLSPETTSEILETVSGLTINRSGGILQSASLSIRGSGSEQVLILVNGRKLNSAGGGSVDLNSIDPRIIERIEIMKGPASAHYGQGALSGVINIVTKQKAEQDLLFDLYGGYGSFNTIKGGGTLSSHLGKEKGLDIIFSANGLWSQSNFTYSDNAAIVKRENADGWRADSSLSCLWMISPKKDISLSFMGDIYYEDKGTPGTIEFPTGKAEMESIKGNGQLSFGWMNNPVAGFRFDLSGSWQSLKYSDPDYYGTSITDSHLNKTLASSISLYRHDDFYFFHFKTAGGYDFLYEALNSTRLAESGGTEGKGSACRFSHSLFLRQEWHLFPSDRGGEGRIIIYPAVRYDLSETRYETDGTRIRHDCFSYSFGISGAFDRKRTVVLKGQIGTAYRLPTFNDLFWPSTSFAVGNPYLKPEDSKYLELTLAFSPVHWLSAEASCFYQDVKNLIQWNPGAGGTWRPGNIGKAVLSGFDSNLNLNFPIRKNKLFLDMTGGYTYLSALNKIEGSSVYNHKLPGRPSEQFFGAVSLRHSKGHFLTIKGTFVGYRYTNAQNTNYLPGYFTLDAVLNICFTRWLKLTVKADNIFNKSYVDILNWPVPGRQFSILLTFTGGKK